MALTPKELREVERMQSQIEDSIYLSPIIIGARRTPQIGGAEIDVSSLSVGDVVELRERPGVFLINGLFRLFSTTYTAKPLNGGADVKFTPEDIKSVRQNGAFIEAPPVPFMKTKNGKLLWQGAALASSVAGAYHGYKRNQSVGWALWWSAMGGMFPIITPVIAVAQGFGKKK